MAKLTSVLVERQHAAAGDALIDEARSRSAAAPTAKGLSRTEAIAATKQRFLEDAAPVEQRVTKLGGEIPERAWINGCILARVPVSSVSQLARRSPFPVLPVLWRKAGAPTVTPQTFISRVSRRGCAYQNTVRFASDGPTMCRPTDRGFSCSSPHRQPTFSVVLR